MNGVSLKKIVTERKTSLAINAEIVLEPGARSFGEKPGG